MRMARQALGENTGVFCRSYQRSNVPYTDSATAEVTIRAVREIMSRWGLSLMMVSDNGPCFKDYELAEFCQHNHIKHITVSPQLLQMVSQNEPYKYSREEQRNSLGS